VQEPALVGLIVEVNFPDPPVFAEGRQPETVPTEVMYPFDGVFVTGGWKVDVPFRVLQLLVVAAVAGDAVRTAAVPVASESAKAAYANLDRVFMRSTSLGAVSETPAPVTRR
jgi:hypothetical protein